MIRPIVTFQKENWFFEIDEGRLVCVTDTKKCKEIDVMNKIELEELSDSVMLLERDVCDMNAYVDGVMDVLDYNESFKEQGKMAWTMGK
jgi:hypothetical protein